MTKSEINFLNLFLVVVDGRKIIVRPRGPRGWSQRYKTIFFEPQRRGRGLFFTPHVSENGQRHKPFFARVSPARVTQVFKALSDELESMWLAACVPADLTTLEQAGWFAVEGNDERFLQWVRSRSDAAGRVVVTRNGILDYMLGEIEAAVPLSEIASRDEKPDKPIALVVADGEGALDLAFLYWFPMGFPKGQGWYVVRDTWLDKRRLLATLCRETPRTFWTGVRRVMRVLRIGDVSRVETIIDSYSK